MIIGLQEKICFYDLDEQKAASAQSGVLGAYVHVLFCF